MAEQIETNLTNQGAFAELENAMTTIGRPFSRGSIVLGPPRPDDIVALGLEREISVLTSDPFEIGGKLSVRALMAGEGAEDILRFAVTPQQAVKWLIRTRLKFVVPGGRHTNKIDFGEHQTVAAYLLSSDGPKRLDDYFDTEESEAKPDMLHGFVETGYHHSLPTTQGAVIEAYDNSARTLMLRKWFERLPRNDGMMMLSPTSAGQVSRPELPATIAWLLKEPSYKAPPIN